MQYVRTTNLEEKYLPVKKYNEQRYRIAFDKVSLEGGIATWSLADYFEHPTTEQVQEDVRDMTIQRYINEGLEPPKREDIDVSPYVID